MGPLKSVHHGTVNPLLRRLPSFLQCPQSLLSLLAAVRHSPDQENSLGSHRSIYQWRRHLACDKRLHVVLAFNDSYYMSANWKLTPQELNGIGVKR